MDDMNIATIAYRRAAAPPNDRWRQVGTVHYDARSHWCSLVIGAICTDLMVADATVEGPPFIRGDIMTCTKARGTPVRLGAVWTDVMPDGKTQYKVRFDAVPVAGYVLSRSDNAMAVFPVFLDDAEEGEKR